MCSSPSIDSSMGLTTEGVHGLASGFASTDTAASVESDVASLMSSPSVAPASLEVAGPQALSSNADVNHTPRQLATLMLLLAPRSSVSHRRRHSVHLPCGTSAA